MMNTNNKAHQINNFKLLNNHFAHKIAKKITRMIIKDIAIQIMINCEKLNKKFRIQR